MDEFKGVADVERIIGDAQTGAVTLDDRAAFGFALNAADALVILQYANGQRTSFPAKD